MYLDSIVDMMLRVQGARITNACELPLCCSAQLKSNFLEAADALAKYK